MSLDLLLNPSASENDVNSVVENLISNLSEDSFKNFFDSLNGKNIGYNILANFLFSLSQALSKITNLSLQVKCLRILVQYLENSQIEDKKFDIYEIHAKSLQANEFYGETAKILEKFPVPSSDAEILKYYLDIAECYFSDTRYDKVTSLLIKMGQHIFKYSTPIDLWNRYHSFKGKYNINKKSFLEAARCYNELWTRGTTPESRLYGLRTAAICAILSPTTNNIRSLLLHRYAADENIKNVDIYPILDLIVRGKFIDKTIRDDFREKISDLVDSNDTKTLESFSVQHNISVARKMFSSIQIDRLAQIVGDSPDNVYHMLSEMINNKSLKASIDQPQWSVEFAHENKRSLKDKSIRDFCLSVSETSAKIKELLK